MEFYSLHIDTEFDSMIDSNDRKIVDAYVMKYEIILQSFKEKHVNLNKRETKLFQKEHEKEYRNNYKNVANGYLKSKNIVFENSIINITKLLDEAKEKQATLPEVISNTHFECECGSSVLITNKARHLKSPGHLIMKTNESAIEIEVEKTYTCECGSTVLISNKARHLKSQSHNAKKEGDEKEEEKESSKKEPYAKDYICGCGKRVFKSNKFNHSHTSYHMDWVNQYIIDTVETD